VIFFHENCTSRLKLTDLGVIHVTRDTYWKTLAQKAIAATEREAELKLSVMQAMNMKKSPRNSVNSVVISSCFRKAGFVNTSTSEQLAKGLDEEEVEEDWKEVTSNPEIQSLCEL
jgi:hypothetical protein